jgi:hypothetical protein
MNPMSNSTDSTIPGLSIVDGPYPTLTCICGYCGSEFEYDTEDMEGLAGFTGNAHDLHD